LASLPEKIKDELREKVYDNLPVEPDGSIKLLGRAIAIKGKS